jgi:hypothetical protein
MSLRHGRCTPEKSPPVSLNVRVCELRPPLETRRKRCLLGTQGIEQDYFDGKLVA